MASPKYYRMSEISTHKSPASLWLVIHNSVYDVSKFLDQHPGGSETLIEHAGQDATEAFEDVGHSDAARLDLKKYKIGDLHPEDMKKEKKNRLIMAAVATLAAGVLLAFIYKRSQAS